MWNFLLDSLYYVMLTNKNKFPVRAVVWALNGGCFTDTQIVERTQNKFAKNKYIYAYAYLAR